MANTGDRVTLSGNVALEGTVGTAGGPRTQFRFASSATTMTATTSGGSGIT